MTERTVGLVVHTTGNCPLLKTAERWYITGREVRTGGMAKMCGTALCSLYPKVQALLKTVPQNSPLPDDYLLCDADGCDASFRMEFVTAPPPLVAGKEAPPKLHESAFTRRLEKGAQAATAILKKHGPFLSRLPKDVASDLINACQTVRFDSGQIVLMQGVVGEHLYIVAEGQVEVAKRSDGNNDETILVTLDPGNCFGEMSILTGEITSAEVRAKGPAAILTLTKDRLEALLLRRPVLSREFSKLLAERLKATNTSLQTELNRGIIGKLSMISLVDLVQTLGQSGRTGTLVLNYYGQQARLGFKAGKVVSGICGDIKGDEAFHTVVCWPDGDFCFEQAEPSADPADKIKADMMGLMMEGMRRMDEAKAAQAKKAEGAMPPA